MAPVEEDWAVDDYVRSKEKAWQLLKSVLPEHSWHNFERNGVVTIKGKMGEYVISADGQTEIRDLASGKRTSRACMQLSIPAPAYDRMVAEYLLIKNAEDSYLYKANIFNNDFSPEMICVVVLILDIALFLNFIFELITSRL